MNYKHLATKLYRALKWFVYAVNDLMPFIISTIILLSLLGYGWGLYQEHLHAHREMELRW